jgi:hypothetical protein
MKRHKHRAPGLLTAEQSSEKTANRQNGNVHLLPLDKESLIYRTIVAIPESIDVMANVAVPEGSAQSCQDKKMKPT